MAFSNLASRLNDAELRVFGESVTWTRRQTAVSVAVTGILEVGQLDEPVDSGVNARFSTKASNFSTAPVNGDLITVGTRVYNIVDVEADGEGWLQLRLRKQKDTA